jgi:hypothetical protein
VTTAGIVEVEHAGTQYRASWSVKSGLVHLLTPLGKTVPKPVGTSSPDAVARGMLKQMLHDRDSRWKPVR